MNQRKLIPANGISTVAVAMPPCPLLNQSIELSVPSAMLVRGPRRCGFTRDVESRRSFRGPPAGPGEQTRLHVGTARVVAEDRRSARGASAAPLLIRPGGRTGSQQGRSIAVDHAGASFGSRIRGPAGAADMRAGASGADRAGAARDGRAGIHRLGGWPPLVTSRAEGVQLAAGPGRRRRSTGSPPGCRSARSPARRRS